MVGVTEGLGASSVVTGGLDGMETKEVATYGTVLGVMVPGESTVEVGSAGWTGENLEREEPGDDVGPSKPLVVVETLWVVREDAVLEGFNVDSGKGTFVMDGPSKEEESWEDGRRAVIGSFSFSEGIDASSLA